MCSEKIKYIIITPLIILLLTITWPIFALYFLIVYLILKRKTAYGNFLKFPSTNLDEDHLKINIAKSGNSGVLLLEGDISLKEVQDLFQKNALEAKLGNSTDLENQKNLRYPELQQYITSFMGVRIWKNEENFTIAEHIVEGPKHWTKLSLESIHEENLNQKFPWKKSPWKIILVRAYSGVKCENEAVAKTVVVFYIHHTLADAKSCLNLVVEGFAKTELNTVKSQWNPKKPLVYYLTFPFLIIFDIFTSRWFMLPFLSHPWRNPSYFPSSLQVPHFVRLTERIPMSGVKSIGKEFKVSSTSVLFGIFAGAVKKSNPDMKDFPIAVPLPKPWHPNTLTNHMYVGGMMLPCSVESIKNRIKECHKRLQIAKQSLVGIRFEGFYSFLTNFLPNPLQKFVLRDAVFSVISSVTNVAGPMEKISIGGRPCIDFTAVNGTMQAPFGVAVLIQSYNGNIRYAVIADQNILPKEDLQLLIINIRKEYEGAMELSKNLSDAN